MPDTTRLGLRRPVGADTFALSTDLQDVVDTLDNAALYAKGTLAAIPAANSVPDGTIYRATDTGVFYESTGAAWLVIGKRPDGDIAGAEIGPLPVCLAYRSSQSTSSGVVATIDFTDADLDDALGMHSPTSNSQNLYAPIAGLYEAKAEVSWASSGTGYRAITIRESTVGGPVGADTSPAVNGAGTVNHATGIVRLDVDDYVYCTVLQSSTFSLNAWIKMSLRFICS